ncbi:MAG: cytochrome c maturation protein CcmE [Acidobacteriota bacterium]
MAAKKLKFVAGSILIVGAVVLLAFSGFQESKAYYQTVDELRALGSRAEGVRIRVAGEVVPGSIIRRADAVQFTISQGEDELVVRYVGKDPLPDTLVDRSQAVAEGYLRPGGTFEASMVQAKCASKYEAAYGDEAATGYQE